MFCIPIEKKPESCGMCKLNCWSDSHNNEYCYQLDKELPDSSVIEDFIDPDCPIVEMPDVEGILKMAIDTIMDIVDDECGRIESVNCMPSERTTKRCKQCWREYLEAKLKESEE